MCTFGLVELLPIQFCGAPAAFALLSLEYFAIDYLHGNDRVEEDFAQHESKFHQLFPLHDTVKMNKKVGIFTDVH